MTQASTHTSEYQETIPSSYSPTTLDEFRQNWMALLAAILGTGFGIATLVFYTTGLFVPSLKAEFGWTMSQLSLLPLIGAIVIIVTSPFVGALVDKVGTRFPPAISLALLGIAFCILTVAGPSFSIFMIAWIAMYIFSAASTPVSFTRIITTRFDKARGLALGIALGGAGIVAFFVPKFLGALIAENWRMGYYILAGAVLCAATLFFILMTLTHKKESKQKKNLVRANTEVSTTEIVEKIIPVSKSLVIKLTAIFLFIPLAVGGMTLHLVPMLRENGLTPTEAAGIASLIGISVVFGRVIIGLLIDRIFAPWIAAIVMLIVAAGFGSLLFLGPAYSAGAAIGLGLALGAEVDLIGYLTGRYFGIKKYGKFFGGFYAMFNVGLGLAPFLVTLFYNTSGSYSLPLSLSVILLIVTAGILLTLPKYNYQAQAVTH